MFKFEDVNKIGFSGKFCSGKTTIAEALVKKYGFKRVAIADNIKLLCNHLINDYEEKTMKTIKFLKETMQLKHDEALGLLGILQYSTLRFHEKPRKWEKTNDVYEYKKNDDYREFTQYIGTIVRQIYGLDIWVKWYLNTVNKLIDNNIPVVCDDIRLKKEKEILEQNGFYVIRLNITEKEQNKRHLKLYGSEASESRKRHVTETDLDNAEFNLIIENTGKIEEAVKIIEKEVLFDKNNVLHSF